jgi:hypothetical protein
MLPKAIQFYKDSAATKIQKYLRGYKVTQKHFTRPRFTKLKINADFFDKMNDGLKDYAVRVIQKQFKVYRDACMARMK